MTDCNVCNQLADEDIKATAAFMLAKISVDNASVAQPSINFSEQLTRLEKADQYSRKASVARAYHIATRH